MKFVSTETAQSYELFKIILIILSLRPKDYLKEDENVALKFPLSRILNSEMIFF